MKIEKTLMFYIKKVSKIRYFFVSLRFLKRNIKIIIYNLKFE